MLAYKLMKQALALKTKINLACINDSTGSPGVDCKLMVNTSADALKVGAQKDYLETYY